MRSNINQMNRVSKEFGIKPHEGGRNYWKRRTNTCKAQGKHSSHAERTASQIMAIFTTYIPATITPPRG